MLNNIPVNKTGHGIIGGNEFAGFMAFHFSGGIIFTKLRTPSANPSLPPSISNPKIGTINPPIKRPAPLIVSETATALSPPNIA